jgi:hypothetical protein
VDNLFTLGIGGTLAWLLEENKRQVYNKNFIGI